MNLDCYKHFHSTLQDIYRLYQAGWKRHRLVQDFMLCTFMHLADMYIYTYTSVYKFEVTKIFKCF